MWVCAIYSDTIWSWSGETALKAATVAAASVRWLHVPDVGFRPPAGTHVFKLFCIPLIVLGTQLGQRQN